MSADHGPGLALGDCSIQQVSSAARELAWVDDTSPDALLALLHRYGSHVNTVAGSPEPAAEQNHPPPYQVIPLQDGWFRIGPDEQGRLTGCFVDDPARPEVVGQRLPILFDDDADDLAGWMRARADIDGSGRRWISVLRRPEREAYAAVVYDAGEDGAGPVRQHVMAGIYPDISLCDDGTRLVFVEPDRDNRGATRAVLAEPGDRFDATRQEVRYSAQGGQAVRPCSVRRFFKLSHGVRSVRIWDLVDARSARPTPISVPGTPRNPDLFDVAILDDDVVLVQASNDEQHWSLAVALLADGDILQTWQAATGPGRVREVTSGPGCALVRVHDGRDEHLLRVSLAGFSTHAPTMQTSAGTFNLAVNTVSPAIGHAAVELTGGVPPFAWYWSETGQTLNSPAELADRAATQAHHAIERVTSEDGYVFELDLRWRQHHGDTFSGPVVLMVYGAYGIDLDLDTDRDLGLWLDRGFAVATPHGRGGGPPARHQAGCRANRDRSLADVRAAIRWLRRGSGAATATRLAVLGASAGGFLAATTLNLCPDEVDACVIVNGFVDPLTSLNRQDTHTTASDRDEWGDPTLPTDVAALQAISPVEQLTYAGAAKALVIVSGCDARVNPRQGVKWYLRYRGLGGDATLWFDPRGAHDCWGAGMARDALVTWVAGAFDAVQPHSTP